MDERDMADIEIQGWARDQEENREQEDNQVPKDEEYFVTEAEASVMLEWSGRQPVLYPTPNYVGRITKEWFSMRRALGAEPYDKRSCTELISDMKKLARR